MEHKICDSNKIRNPDTNRCIDINGIVAKKIIEKHKKGEIKLDDNNVKKFSYLNVKPKKENCRLMKKQDCINSDKCIWTIGMIPGCSNKPLSNYNNPNEKVKNEVLKEIPKIPEELIKKKIIKKLPEKNLLEQKLDIKNKKENCRLMKKQDCINSDKCKWTKSNIPGCSPADLPKPPSNVPKPLVRVNSIKYEKGDSGPQTENKSYPLLNCDSTKIKNPITNRCVQIDGDVARNLIDKHNKGEIKLDDNNVIRVNDLNEEKQKKIIKKLSISSNEEILQNKSRNSNLSYESSTSRSIDNISINSGKDINYSEEDIEDKYNNLLNIYRNKGHEEFNFERKKILKFFNNKDYFKYNIKKYIPYPDYNDRDFNKKIFLKKEFNNKSLNKEPDFDETSKELCSSENFKLTQNQKFIKNFMSPYTSYNSLLLYHNVGVGKSCTAISIAEQYQEIYNKKVLVILSSTLVDNFKKQIFNISKYNIKTNEANLCTGTKYPDMLLDKKNIDSELLEKRVNKLINDKYQFIGYKELAILINNVKEKISLIESNQDKIERKTNEKLSEIFSDRLIIVDEAHNLRNPSETGGNKQISKAFKELFNYVHNVKLVLLTATPMFNNAHEIVWTLNLLLANDKKPELTRKMIFDIDGNLTDKGKKILIKVSRGYISYMRGENPFSFPFRLFPSINDDINLLKKYPKYDLYRNVINKEDQIKYLEIITSEMSNYQKNLYDKIKNNIDISEKEEEFDDDNAITNDLQKSMQISNIVYPISLNDYSYGSEGFNSCFNMNRNKFTYKDNNNQFLNYNNIEKYSPKIKKIIDYIINSKGIVFIYSRYYDSGIKPLAIALEHIGISKYNNNNIANNIDVDDKFNGKKPKYIIISRKKELSPNNDKEIDICKSENNSNGEIIKVIIVSKVGTEGIDFKRIREIHLLEPWFNLNRAEQIIGRGVRYCSHLDLPKSMRNVTIMFHACIYDNNEESIDLRTYRLAETKQKKIIEIEQILKENSIDCNLNKESLIYDINKLNISFDIETSQGKLIKSYKIGDRDYSFICGFNKCISKCNPNIDTSKNFVLDESTFNNKFVVDDINLYKKYISNLYKTKTNYTYEQIYKKLLDSYQIDKYILSNALDDMVINKYNVNNNNKKGYLIYISDKYIFQNLQYSDIRMTIEERENEVYNKKYLPLNVLSKNLDKPEKSVVIHNETINKIKSKKYTDIIDKINLEYNKNSKIIYEYIIDYYIRNFNTKDKLELSNILQDNNVDILIKNIIDTDNIPTIISTKIQTIYDKIHEMINNIKQYIIDSIIDRLNKEEFIELIEKLVKSKLESDIEKNCLESLNNALIIKKVDNTIKYYYNYFTNEFYCLKNNSFKQCNPIDLSNIDEYYTQIKKYKEESLKKNTNSYIYIKDDMIQFKVRLNEKSNGFVCHLNSNFTNNNLIETINRVFPNFITEETLIKKATKINLCYIFEILSRYLNSNKFQRPHFI